MEATNSSRLISDLLDTADLEALLNPIVLEPGWLESLASSQSFAPDLAKYWAQGNSTKPNFEWRKWGKTKLLYGIATSDIQLVLPKTGGSRQLVLSDLYSALFAGYFSARKTLAELAKCVWLLEMAREFFFFVMLLIYAK